MMKIYRFLMVLGLLVWMAQNVSSQSRYDKTSFIMYSLQRYQIRYWAMIRGRL